MRFEGAESARPAPGVIEALAAADAILFAPSNPYVSIAPILAVRAIRAEIERRRVRSVAVSPLIGGQGGQGPGRPYALAHGRRDDTGTRGRDLRRARGRARRRRR